MSCTSWRRIEANAGIKCKNLEQKNRGSGHVSLNTEPFRFSGDNHGCRVEAESAIVDCYGSSLRVRCLVEEDFLGNHDDLRVHVDDAGWKEERDLVESCRFHVGDRRSGVDLRWSSVGGRQTARGLASVVGQDRARICCASGRESGVEEELDRVDHGFHRNDCAPSEVRSNSDCCLQARFGYWWKC